MRSTVGSVTSGKFTSAQPQSLRVRSNELWQLLPSALATGKSQRHHNCGAAVPLDPVIWLTSFVRNGEHDHDLLTQGIGDVVRKNFEVHTPVIAATQSRQSRILGNPPQMSDHFQPQPLTEAGLLGFVIPPTTRSVRCRKWMSMRRSGWQFTLAAWIWRNFQQCNFEKLGRSPTN